MATLQFKAPKMPSLTFDPKRKYGFLVEFPEELNIKPYAIQRITKPSVKFSKKEINLFNIIKYSSLKYKWNNIEIELFDLIYPSTSAAVVDLIEFCENKKGKKFTFKIKVLDPFREGIENGAGDVLETWTIDVQDIVSVDFGKYDYGSKEVQKIKLILKPSDCRLD
jgi:hypothetical protein